MRPKLGIIDKYRPLWEGGKSVEKYNVKVGFKIRMFVVSQITSQRQKNPNLLNQKDIEQLTDMIKELKEDKATISPEDQTCSLEDYQKFLFDFFNKVDYEDRHETVTIKTTSKFRLMASFIDVLSTWGPIDEEMVKCKKYCQFKAVDIFKALKRGEIPKRGGPKEQIEDNNENNKNENNNNNIIENKKNINQNNAQSNNITNGNHNLKNNKNNFEQNKNINKVNNQANQKSMNNNNIDKNQHYNLKNQTNNNIKRDSRNNENYNNKNNLNLNNKNNNYNSYRENINKKENLNNTNPNINYKQQLQKGQMAQRKINIEQKNDLMNKTEINKNFQKFQSQNPYYNFNKNFDNNIQNNNQNHIQTSNYKKINTLQMNSNKLKANNNTSSNPNNFNYNQNKNNNMNSNYKRKSLVVPSQDGNKKKRTFKGKYKLTTYIPVKYNTVPYFMLIENVRINNDNALKALKRGKAENVLNIVLDSLDFLTYVHK